MLEDSYSNKDTIYMKMYITMELYNEVLGLTNYFFFLTPVMVKFKGNMKKKLDIS